MCTLYIYRLFSCGRFAKNDQFIFNPYLSQFLDENKCIELYMHKCVLCTYYQYNENQSYLINVQNYSKTYVAKIPGFWIRVGFTRNRIRT